MGVRASAGKGWCTAMYREAHSHEKETTKTAEWAKHKKALTISETVSVIGDWPMQPARPIGTTWATSGEKKKGVGQMCSMVLAADVA